jgi:hypothetical protein
MVTTKPPSWEDPLVRWRDSPLTLGVPHEGFFYPDPLGFWAEVRRWALVLFRVVEPGWDTAEALALTSLLHTGGAPERLARALEVHRPRVVVFLDEEAWAASRLPVAQPLAHRIPDPHRPGQSYEGFWARDAERRVVGKSPQHPAAHRLYRAADLDAYLAAAPLR